MCETSSCAIRFWSWSPNYVLYLVKTFLLQLFLSRVGTFVFISMWWLPSSMQLPGCLLDSDARVCVTVLYLQFLSRILLHIEIQFSVPLGIACICCSSSSLGLMCPIMWHSGLYSWSQMWYLCDFWTLPFSEIQHSYIIWKEAKTVSVISEPSRIGDDVDVLKFQRGH